MEYFFSLYRVFKLLMTIMLCLYNLKYAGFWNSNSDNDRVGLIKINHLSTAIINSRKILFKTIL